MNDGRSFLPHVLTKEAIDAEYTRRGDALGWSFLTCPAANLKQATVAIVTTNPGGRVFEAPRWSCEEGSSYVVEEWLSCKAGEQQLQRQVQRMCALVPADPAEVLSGYFIPFRSPSMVDLRKRREAICYASELWQTVFQSAPQIRLILVFGLDVARKIATLLRAAPGVSYPAGWGKQVLQSWDSLDDRRIVGLPHLSRFGLFGSKGTAIAEASFRSAISKAEPLDPAVKG